MRYRTSHPIRAAVALVALALTSCASPMTVAIRTANGARAVGEVARSVITAACVAAYNAASTREQVSAVDARCQPAERAYRTYAAAHLTAVLVIQREQLGLATEADAIAAVRAVGQAGAALEGAVRAVAP